MENTSIKENRFNKFPFIDVPGEVISGWTKIVEVLLEDKRLITIDCYQGVLIEEIESAFNKTNLFFKTEDLFKREEQIKEMTQRDVTKDEVFGFITSLKMKDFFCEEKLVEFRNIISKNSETIIVCGPGASLVVENPDVRLYADMARWEIQKRMKQGKVHGLGVNNSKEPFNLQYKRGFFVDWRVCDNHKINWLLKCDYLLDTNKIGDPKLVEMDIIKEGFRKAVKQPFSVVPFFDPGPWGGHWMENQFDLNITEVPNYAWCFNCVPEENSLLFKINNQVVELPSVNLVFFESVSLLGDTVEARFGKEFPIRFDFLDTMGGGNLSLQVHPDTSYIQKNFGMNYTQDESYYLLDVKGDSVVYLGLKEEADVDKMFLELENAQREGKWFYAENYVNIFSAKKHDHFLIPAGTVHCSGKNSMVLEISATPYIFTFKMWDWGRLGLDGNPRPININHAKNVIRTDWRYSFVNNELVNQIEVLEKGDGWIEERTGLHKRTFIETRRHWFSKAVTHIGNGSVNVLMLVEGEEALVESPDSEFEPFLVRYAEAFILPAAVNSYRISPFGKSSNKTIATIKAYVRF